MLYAVFSKVLNALRYRYIFNKFYDIISSLCQLYVLEKLIGLILSVVPCGFTSIPFLTVFRVIVEHRKVPMNVQVIYIEGVMFSKTCDV